MPLDLSLQALLNSAGGFAFAAVGALGLWIARADRDGRLVAALATVFGATYVISNVWPFNALAPLVVATLLHTALVVLAVRVTLVHVRQLSARSRRVLVGLALTIAAAATLANAYGALRMDEIGVIAEPDTTPAQARYIAVGVTGFFVSTATLAILVTACALAFRDTARGRERERRALALHACAYGLFVSFATSFVFPEHLPLNAGLLIGLVPMATWALVSDGPLARRVTLALVAAAAVGVAVGWIAVDRGLSWSTDFGIPGALRTVGAFLLALAILRHGLIGDAARTRGTRRGPVAIAALASLLIVAQVAQNFLEAQYGLLMGSVVAGAVLFAAHPIQRALEQRSADPAVTPARPDVAARERSFKAAARRFHKDGAIDRDEERELIILAEHLGIAASRAYELRDEVAAEREAGSARP